MVRFVNVNCKTRIYKSKGLKIILPDLIVHYIEYKQYIIINILSGLVNSSYVKNGKWRGGYVEGIKSEYSYEGGNVFCYDAKGALLWQWHEKGITGMRLVDQEYIEEQRRSINTSRETLLEKGYSEDKIVAKDYVNPLLHPEGQIELFNGIGMAHLVEIATGKELDRWETR
ncbi:hypothetical protein [Polaribacter sp. HL-MS24]|uniref:hypothetical protein n=1 Tax=Polaribacter sp. HL-MS24 TaxID=3077735 RepID=UPI0029349400|nr:hypothetical protein [Polaribacter sp. HL-MS24]WOC40025.1 hypothetical protein RRF69_10450 [Polaribacter sp. HL-MS24]